MSRERIPEMVVIDASAIDSPWVDPHDVLTNAQGLDYELRLPEIIVMFSFPPAETVSDYLRDIRTEMDLRGVRVTTRSERARRPRQGLRTRQLWDVLGEDATPEREHDFVLTPNRRRTFRVPIGEVVDWRMVADVVIEYAATMAMSRVIQDEDEF